MYLVFVFFNTIVCFVGGHVLKKFSLHAKLFFQIFLFILVAQEKGLQRPAILTLENMYEKIKVVLTCFLHN